MRPMRIMCNVYGVVDNQRWRLFTRSKLTHFITAWRHHGNLNGSLWVFDVQDYTMRYLCENCMMYDVRQTKLMLDIGCSRDIQKHINEGYTNNLKQ